ncbi:hypothetical protein ED5_2451 [Enterobacter roggenkampii]|nr:hypothetical protein ED5_2451 [Enterobacter roggenkampii]
MSVPASQPVYERKSYLQVIQPISGYDVVLERHAVNQY